MARNTSLPVGRGGVGGGSHGNVGPNNMSNNRRNRSNSGYGDDNAIDPNSDFTNNIETKAENVAATGGEETTRGQSHFPVTYSVSWNASTPAMTITLLVPKRRNSSSTIQSPPPPMEEGGLYRNSDGTFKSLFTKIEGKDEEKNDGGKNSKKIKKEQHTLHLPLSYLLSLSSPDQSSNTISAPWLDRQTLRSRLSDGGRAIGLEGIYIHQPTAAVEESAARLPDWVPSGTVGVVCSVYLGDGIVMFLAEVETEVKEEVMMAVEKVNSQPNNTAAVQSNSMPSRNQNISTSRGRSASVPNHQTQNQNHQSKPKHEPKNSTKKKPNPSDIVEPLLSLGFSPRQCQRAMEALRDMSPSPPPPQPTTTQEGSSSNNDTEQITGQDIVDFLFSGDNSSHNNNNNHAGPYAAVNIKNEMGFYNDEHLMETTEVASGGDRSTNTIMTTSISGLTDDEDDDEYEEDDNNEDDYEEEPLGTTPAPPPAPPPTAAIAPSEGAGGSPVLHSIPAHHSAQQQQQLRQQQVQQQHQKYYQQQQQQHNVWGSPNPNITNPGGLDKTTATQQQQPTATPPPPAPTTVWSDTGKLRAVKSNALTDLSPHAIPYSFGTNNEATTNNIQSQQQLQQQIQQPKMVKVLDAPPDLNGFVFHCNAQTRDECLERNLFGCPAGGQYGPHSKAKMGDLLFLADFSSWTVTGIFVAKSDAGMNLERSAWGGRFPWQIRIEERSSNTSQPKLKTVHIDKVNEILGLASGSKLNMLTKDQVLKLMMSREFGPCVPPHLYKMRQAVLPTTTTVVSSAAAVSSSRVFAPATASSQDNRGLHHASPKPSYGGGSNVGSLDLAAGGTATASGNAYTTTKTNTSSSTNNNILHYQHNLYTPATMLCEEHPAAAMHRLKLISSWFDSMASMIQTLNTEYNNVQSGQQTTDAPQQQQHGMDGGNSGNQQHQQGQHHQQQQGQQKEQFFVDEINRLMKTSAYVGSSVAWPWMSYNHIRKGVADVFNQWLFQAHAIGNTDGHVDGHRQQSHSTNDPYAQQNSYDDSGWIRQGRNTSSSSSRRRMGDDPVLLSHVPHALQHVKSLLMSTSGSSSLRVPMEEIADLLANDFIHEMERIASEVQKTQLSHVRNGGEEYDRSVEDAVLGMRLSEEKSSYYNDAVGDGSDGSSMIKIEWVTKASILNVRTPPFQKVFKTHFDLLRRNYCDTSSKTDPDLKHVLTRIFVLLCRYDIISALKGVNHFAIPPRAFEAMSRNFGISHECFASPLNRVSHSYNSIFPDVDRFFGSLGSFFDFLPIEGSFEANPPFADTTFNGESIKIMFEHIFGLLQRTDTEKHALSFLVVVPNTSDVLSCVSGSPFLRKTAVINTEYGDNYNLMGMEHNHAGVTSIRKVMHGKNSATYHFRQPPTMAAMNGNKFMDGWSSRSPTMLLWLQNDYGYALWTPTEEKVESVVHGFLPPPAYE